MRPCSVFPPMTLLVMRVDCGENARELVTYKKHLRRDAREKGSNHPHDLVGRGDCRVSATQQRAPVLEQADDVGHVAPQDL